ncbi:DHS-like NAD/FAD-binding domain-containing protein, partial [Stipitochalara longipes BDJ]
VKQRELKTEHLDLRRLNDSDDDEHHKIQDAKLRKLMEALRSKRKIVVIAGAGISVSAGIPDFRSSTGLFTTLRSQHKLKASGKHLFDASVYRNDSSTSSFHDMVRELSHLTQKAKPTPFHHMLATLAEEGRLMRLYSQNVDGIDTSLEPLATAVPLNAKGPWPKTIQLHGGLEKMVCTKCGNLSNFDGALFEGPEPPLCKECETTDAVRIAGGLRSHGIGRLRPRMVLYNEFNPDEDAIGAVSAADLKSRPDAVIVVGTSLKVPGIRRLAKEMCSVTRGRRGGFTAWINHDPEPLGIEFKDCWDMVVRGECDDVARLVGLPRWDDKDCGEYSVMERGEKIKKDSHPEVVLDLKSIVGLKTQGILTPTDSPRQQSPAPKLKQAVFSFGPLKPGSEKDLKIKKKPGRKPLPSKPTKGVNKITGAFTSTKTTLVSTKTSDYSEETALFPGLAKTPTTPMRPVSPFDTRNNSDVSYFRPE